MQTQDGRNQSVDPESAGQRETQCTGRQGKARDAQGVDPGVSMLASGHWETHAPSTPAWRGARAQLVARRLMLATLGKASSKSAASPMDFQRCTGDAIPVELWTGAIGLEGSLSTYMCVCISKEH